MNVVRRRAYRLEVDIWEPMQKEAEKELDAVVQFIKKNTSHCGNVRLTPFEEERLDGR